MVGMVNHPKYCIFEKRLCEYAENHRPVFECTCPSDEEMPCSDRRNLLESGGEG
jgi:hypothetical protein